jgi:hypothetical protein
MGVPLKRSRRDLVVAVALAVLGVAAWLLFGPSGGRAGTGTAHAAPPYTLDHFLCYKGQFNPNTPVGANITLRDQFSPQPVAHKVGQPKWFCNPTRKTHQGVGDFPIVHPNNHLTAFALNGRFQKQRLHIVNQFQTAAATDPPNLVTDPGTQQHPKHPLILVPTRKAPLDPPADIDHFKCYPTLPKTVNQAVTVQDQFSAFVPPPSANVLVQRAALLCNPAVKKHGTRTFEVKHRGAHLVCYTITKFQFPTGQRPVAQLRNQFGQFKMTATERSLLCAPSKKQVVH